MQRPWGLPREGLGAQGPKRLCRAVCGCQCAGGARLGARGRLSCGCIRRGFSGRRRHCGRPPCHAEGAAGARAPRMARVAEHAALAPRHVPRAPGGALHPALQRTAGRRGRQGGGARHCSATGKPNTQHTHQACLPPHTLTMNSTHALVYARLSLVRGGAARGQNRRGRGRGRGRRKGPRAALARALENRQSDL